MFSIVLLHGWQFGPSGAPSAIKMIFRWVMTGTIHSKTSHPGHQGPEVTYFSATMEDNLLELFWETEDYRCKEASLSLDERAVVEHF